MEYTFKYLQQGIYIHLYIRNNIHLQENIVWYHDIHHNIHHIYYMSWYSPGIFVDLGIYGWSPLPNWAGKDPTLRMFEKFTLKHGGYQVLSRAIQKACKDFWGHFQATFPGPVRWHPDVLWGVLPDVLGIWRGLCKGEDWLVSIWYNTRKWY